MNKPHVAYAKAKLLVMRYLHLVKFGDVDHKRPYDCRTIERVERDIPFEALTIQITPLYLVKTSLLL
jgi:hypothetical protein